MNTKWFTSGSGRVNIRITSRDAEKCNHPGPCDSDVKELMQKQYIKKQLASISAETLANELKEYGAWDDTELANHYDNLTRIVWIAAGDISERKKQ